MGSRLSLKEVVVVLVLLGIGMALCGLIGFTLGGMVNDLYHNQAFILGVMI
jgi:hypothetical protein